MFFRVFVNLNRNNKTKGQGINTLFQKAVGELAENLY